MARRTGLPTIKQTCVFLCAFLAVYIPVVKKVFPDDDDLHAALELLQVAVCAAIPVIDPILEPGD